MRSNDASAAVKAGADLVQNLGVAAPVAHANAGPLQSTAAAAGAPTPVAAVPVADLAVEIASQALAGKNRFEIRLDPPELGRIDVRLEIDRDGQVKSRLVVERVETLDMLRRDAPQLERALQQAGLKTSDHALEFSLRQHAPQHDDETQQNAARLVVPDDGAASLDAVQQNYGRRLGLGGGIDIRV
jgi:flagellar hook-length control protein FliK